MTNPRQGSAVPGEGVCPSQRSRGILPARKSQRLSELDCWDSIRPDISRFILIYGPLQRSSSQTRPTRGGGGPGPERETTATLKTRATTGNPGKSGVAK
jgi:hypothetical protein